MPVPLLTIPHNWVTSPQRTLRWPSAVLPARDGHSQSIAQSLDARQTLKYSLTVLNPETAAEVMAAVVAAAGATTSQTRGQVRVPRWEDAMVLSSAVAIGATALALLLSDPTDDAGYRHFADGAEIALWDPRKPRQIVTLTLAALGSVATAALTLAAATVQSFPAGTRVAPVSVARLTEPVAWDRITGTIATATLGFTLEAPIAGAITLAGGTAGTSQTAVVASITLVCSEDSLYIGFQARIRAICKDANGVVVRPAGPLTWTQVLSGGAGPLALKVIDPDSGTAFIEAVGTAYTGLSSTVTIKATDPISGVFGIIAPVLGPGA